MTIPAPPTAPGTVRTATAADAPALTTAMAAAFRDDPVFAWFVPPGRGRTARLERFFATIALPATLPHGASTTTDGHPGAALWVPPGAPEDSALDLLRMLPAMARVSGRGLVRTLRGVSAMEAAQPKADHWYLWLAGVAPAWQGRGVGSLLLRPVLDRCDADGVPAYLEATTERSRALYARHGFVARDALRLPGGGPTLWPMWREPRSG